MDAAVAATGAIVREPITVVVSKLVLVFKVEAALTAATFAKAMVGGSRIP
jgi:hypothetical protein